MNLLKKRIAATEAKIEQFNEARKAAQKASRLAHKQSKQDRLRRVMLAGEAVLRRVERGEMDEAEFQQMMDEYLSQPLDRKLFDLE
jgi:lipase chaperone LimK